MLGPQRVPHVVATSTGRARVAGLDFAQPVPPRL